MELLAPNGRPSNLTPEQYRLVRTPEFKKFFGDWEKLAYAKLKDPAMDEITLNHLSKDVSKIVDENGEPLVVYHGTTKKFNEFDRSKGFYEGWYGLGFYFTDNLEDVNKNYTSKGYDLKQKIKVLSKQTKTSIKEIKKNIIDDDYLLTCFLKIINPIKIFDKIGLENSKKILKVEQKLIEYGYDVEGLTNYIKSKIGDLSQKNYWELENTIRNLSIPFEKNENIVGEVIRLMYELIGFDGIIMNPYTIFNTYEKRGMDVDEKTVHFICFYSKNIKLADGTNTTFDSKNPDIRYKNGGNVRKKISNGEGDCYYVAGQFAMGVLSPEKIDYKGTPYIVHAEVQGQGHISHIRYGHAWVEDDENVYDFSNNRKIILPKQLYYVIGDVKTDNPKKYRKYTFQEARRKMVETKHYGCWDLDVEYKSGGMVKKDFMKEKPIQSLYNYLEKNSYPYLSYSEESNEGSFEINYKGRKFIIGKLNNMDESVKEMRGSTFDYYLRVDGKEVYDQPNLPKKFMELISNILTDLKSKGKIENNVLSVNNPAYKDAFLNRGDEDEDTWEEYGHQSVKRVIDEVKKIKFPIKVYRGVSENYDKNYEGEAENRSWTTDKSVAEKFAGYFGEIVSKIINEKDVDYEATISRRIMHHALNESEINLNDNGITKKYQIEKMKNGGEVLLAPNGKPSNLTPEQYRLVRTPEFKAWFGDWENSPETASKVVDENGEPLICYHYSPKEFSIFDKKYHPRIADFVENKYHKHLGYDFSTKKGFYQRDNSFVYMVFLNVRNIFNPLIAEDKEFEPIIKVMSKIPYYQRNQYNLSFDIAYLKKGEWDRLELPSVEKYLSKNYDGLIMMERDWLNIKVYDNKNIKLADGTNTTFDGSNPDIRYSGGGNIKKPKFIIEENEDEDRIEISLKNIGKVILAVTYPRYEFSEDVGEDGLNELGIDEDDVIGKIEHIEIEDEYKGKGYAKILMNKAIEIAKERGLMPLYLNASPMGFRGLRLDDLTAFYESFGFEVFLSQGNNNLMILKDKYKKGGRVRLSKTPAPKSERIYGSSMNKPKSSSSSSSASSITFSEDTLEKIKNKISQHNEKHPNKKVSLAVAKAVVRRGMGAYSSTHRPTIKGGKPNSRVAWGLARLNAFLYKIVHGTSKSGRYSQDNDLISELGYRVSKYNNGGEILLAPNGKPSNLTHEQWHLVRTPEFKAWFGDWENDPANSSKVVDTNGEPLPVYHGTSAEPFVVFYGGSFFTDDYMNADGYASGEMVYEVFLNVKKPLIINARGRKWDNLKNKYGNSTRDIVGQLDFEKYDGVIFNNINDNWFDDEMGGTQNVYFSINPEQIKLADGTNTTFDANNPDIRFAGGGNILLAPNGKPSNLTPEQYRLVRTPEFKAWFGDWENNPNENMLLENGEPMVLWKGDRDDFNIFDIDKTGSKRFFFTPSEEYAKFRGEVVKSYFVKSDIIYRENSAMARHEFMPESKYLYPLLITPPVGSPYNEIIAFNPNQIKLADGTNTTFDTNNPDIRFKKGGSVLLAPNGKPSKLTPEQYRLVRTPEFKAWFGDWENDPENASKVVDENGEPLPVYHGTYREYTSFDISKVGNTDKGFFSKGFYFTPNQDLARYYGNKVYKCFLNIKNPIFTKSREDLANYLGLEYNNNTYSEIARDKIVSLKYDGVLQEYDLPIGVKALYPFIEIVAYYPEQIKLADGTNTTFDSNNPDIRYTDGGQIPPYVSDDFQIGYNGAYEHLIAPNFEHTLKQLYPNIFLLEMNSQYDLATTFAKVQAFYEWDNFRGKKFNIDEFYTWYSINKPELKPYAEEFYGFNVPSNEIKECYRINTERTPYDNFLLYIIAQIKSKYKSNNFYLIGAVKGDSVTLKHEMAHAFFWADPLYKQDMTRLVNEIENKDELLEILATQRGYGKNVLMDEAQAFLSTGLIVEISAWENHRQPFIERFNQQLLKK